MITDDPHIVLRETPPWQVRERWAKICLRVHEIELERELCDANYAEQSHENDEVLPMPLPAPRKLTWIEEKLETLLVLWCRFSHRPPSYIRGDDFYTCPTCSRKYAAPWADVNKLGLDVYLSDYTFVKPLTPTQQAHCRNGWID